MKKFFGGILIVFLAAVVFLIVAKDWVLKSGIEQVVTRLTGFETKLEDLKYDFPSTIQIKGLRINNPAGFEQKTFVNIPEIFISLVLADILSGKQIHLPEVRLNIQEVNIEKKSDGVSNVELLSSVGGQGSTKGGAPAKAEPAEKKAAMPFWLEKLDLTVRNVSYEDRSGLLGATPGLVPKKLAVDLNLRNEIFVDIKDPVALVNIILVKILNSATLGRILDIDPQKLLGDNFAGVLNSGQALVTKNAQVLGKGLESVTGQAAAVVSQSEVTQKAEQLLKGTSGEAKEVLGATTSAVKDQVSGLFGKLKTLQPEEIPAEKAQ